MARTRSRSAFTLIELLIVIAIIGILVAIIGVAVTKAKELSNLARCGTQLRDLVAGVQTFHSQHNSYPTYNGIFPGGTTTTAYSNNSRAVYGGWYTHLLPYVGGKTLHDRLRSEYQSFGNGGGNVSLGGGTLITPGAAAYWDPPQQVLTPGQNVPNPNAGNTTQTTINGNGYTIVTGTPQPATIWQPATYVPGTGTYHPAVTAVYAAPGAPYNGPIGVWKSDVRSATFPHLMCPSDSPGDASNAGGGQVYKASQTWGATNYVANWNAITNGDKSKGYQALPNREENIANRDGIGNTILFAEAYSWCEGKGRTALVAWHSHGSASWGGVHNFGLTYSLNNANVTYNGSSQILTGGNGVQNPSSQINFGFQIQPHPTRIGNGGCVALTVQSPHSSLNVAMGDRSVRRVNEKISNAQWLSLMLPEDGGAVPELD